jgi:putative protein-disulfide isomerase
MDTAQLIYFSDPMCSWCWGFAPVITAIRRRFGSGLPIRLVMGGLRPGTDKPMSREAWAGLDSHWVHVTEASGQPFHPGLKDREGFVYDTDPAARAVVILRRHDMGLALAFLERAQRAFYAENQDVTDPQVLADLAAPFGVQRESFLALMASPEAKTETWTDYAISQRAGVTGFPTLVAGPNADGVYGAVTRGYSPPEQVLGVLENWLAGPADARQAN